MVGFVKFVHLVLKTVMFSRGGERSGPFFFPDNERCEAGILALKLYKHRNFEQMLDCRTWIMVSQLAALSDDEAGHNFLQKVRKMVKEGISPHKYMAMFIFSKMLRDSDSGRCRLMWKEWISLQRKRLDRIEELKQDVTVEEQAALMPETTCPYAIYLLANHRDAPTDQMSDKLPTFVSCLKFFLEELVKTAGEKDVNVSYLIAMVQQISASSVVVLDQAKQERVQKSVCLLCEISIKILRALIKSESNLLKHPDELRLPFMFKKRAGVKDDDQKTRQPILPANFVLPSPRTKSPRKSRMNTSTSSNKSDKKRRKPTAQKTKTKSSTPTRHLPSRGSRSQNNVSYAGKTVWLGFYRTRTKIVSHHCHCLFRSREQ